jgi:hypothetical protein
MGRRLQAFCLTLCMAGAGPAPIVGCFAQQSPHGSGADLYDGKIYGIFRPLEVRESAASIVVSGGTFAYTIARATGQITSVRALGREFVAAHSSFPNPYIGLMPRDDPGARRDGGLDRPRFGYEKSAAYRPRLWSGGLTGADRMDAADAAGTRTAVVRAGEESVEIVAEGRYGDTPLSWKIEYLIDVDGFTRVTVTLTTSQPVQLRWHCFNHALLDRQSIRFFTGVSDPGKPPFDVAPTHTVDISALRDGQPVLESHWNAFMHLSNRTMGIEFSKQDFEGRLSGYRDSAITLDDGRSMETGDVETADGRRLSGADSRGHVDVFTQLYARTGVFELEEFDIRNTTLALNPGQMRTRVFWVQATPAKEARQDMNQVRAVWPGPHQLVMTRWRGQQKPWEPPSDEQVRQWAMMGANLIVGGTDYWSGDYTRTLEPEKVRHFIATAHRYGIKVIPYVTFTDFNFAAPGYQEHAADWMASKSIEFASETTLMCYNAAGWREFLEKQWDRLLTDFEFDGLYVDHWINIRLCSNSRHGCGGYIGSFATEGYHDFARRARRVVARHTNGKGIMLLNANMLLFSGVVPWFDIRLSGENDDPLKMSTETIFTSWDGLGQGVQGMGEWNDNQNPRAMLQLLTRFGILGWAVPEKTLDEWRTSLSREFWDIGRFFGVNAARRFSASDPEAPIFADHTDTVANVYAGDGSILLIAGVHGGAGTRNETLHFRSLERLGLSASANYRVIDPLSRRYLGETQRLASLDLSLTADETRVLLVQPADPGPRLVWFAGADRAAARLQGNALEVTLFTVDGSLVDLYLDLQGFKAGIETPGFEQASTGDFIRVSGYARNGQTVRLSLRRANP